jgi:hypothetical protein
LGIIGRNNIKQGVMIMLSGFSFLARVREKEKRTPFLKITFDAEKSALTNFDTLFPNAPKNCELRKTIIDYQGWIASGLTRKEGLAYLKQILRILEELPATSNIDISSRRSLFRAGIEDLVRQYQEEIRCQAFFETLTSPQKTKEKPEPTADDLMQKYLIEQEYLNANTPPSKRGAYPLPDSNKENILIGQDLQAKTPPSKRGECPLPDPNNENNVYSYRR